jgi:thiol-disulfide isomerase/thioredoxin
MTDKTLLHPRDPFPALTVSLPGGRALRLSDNLAGHFGVVLFYRGSWCPYCNAQLSVFQRVLDGLAEMDVTVVALSVDDEATTQELIAMHGLRFPVGTAPTPGDRRYDRARSSTMIRCSCSRPGSCSTPAAGRHQRVLLRRHRPGPAPALARRGRPVSRASAR